MKWFNHKLVTGVTVLLATGNLTAAVPAMIGAIFPDFIEGDVPDDVDSAKYQKWRKRHRRIYHWFPLYFFPGLTAFLLLHLKYGSGALGIFTSFSLDGSINFALRAISNPEIAILFFGAYLCVGGLFHILEDAVCGKVPFVFPSTRIGVRLFTVGSFVEYLLSFGYVFMVAAYKGLL